MHEQSVKIHQKHKDVGKNKSPKATKNESVGKFLSLFFFSSMPISPSRRPLFIDRFVYYATSGQQLW